jgi:hypothetical protein
MDDTNTKQMNPTKERNGDLCEIAMNCCSKGASSLTNFPGLMKEIIETKAWERREWRGKVFELPSLLDLITRKPLEGWGEDPEKVEALIESDPEALSMWRKETTRANHRPLKSNDNIITSSKAKQGTGKAYTLDRLSKENPDLYQSVVNGELSANAAAIAAGWRKKTVTVTDDPASAAKTLREKFGDEWFKAMVQEARMELDPGRSQAGLSKIIIDPFLESITYKGTSENDELRRSLRENGCTEPLIVQLGTNILVDGHKRLKICEEIGISYQVQYMPFESEDEIHQFVFSKNMNRLFNEYDGPAEEFMSEDEDAENECPRTKVYIAETYWAFKKRAKKRNLELSEDDENKIVRHVADMIDKSFGLETPQSKVA